MARQQTLRSLPNGTSSRNTHTPPIVPLTRQRARLHVPDGHYSSDWETSGSESGEQPQDVPAGAKPCIRSRLLVRARGIFRPSVRFRNVTNRPPTPWFQQQLDTRTQNGTCSTGRRLSDSAAGRREDASITSTPDITPPPYGEETVGAFDEGNQPQAYNYSLQPGQGSHANQNALPWEENRAPRNLQSLLPDWPGAAQQDDSLDSGHSSLQHSPIGYYTNVVPHSRRGSLDVSGPPPPSYDNIGYTGSSTGQAHGGLAALYNRVILPPVQSMQPTDMQYAHFGLFTVLPSVQDGEWVNGIMSADSGLAVYRNVFRSFSGDPEAIIHVRDTATRVTASAFFGFRGAGSLVIHRNGQPAERVIIDDSTTLEVEVNDDELLLSSLEM